MHRTERPVRQTLAINLIVDERPALVVGGGQVGLRKVRGLLESGARVDLVCPDAVQPLAQLAAEGRLAWTKRPFAAGDAAGHLAVFACTDDKHVNRAVLDDARRAHVPCCCSDMNWPDGDFTTPATAHLGDLTLAVSTSGQSCRSSRDVKNELVAYLGERYDLQLTVLGTSDALLPSRRRAPFHLPAERRAVLGRLVTRIKGIREFFILNTCNRVEIAVVAAPDADVLALVKRLVGFDRLSANEYFSLAGFEAFRHLVRVSAGLESSLLGEFHVVSQIKDAFQEAETNGWSGPCLKTVANEVLRVSKAVRHAVEGLLRVAEIDQIAVKYLSVHGGLDPETHVVVVGTGMVGTGALEALRQTGVKLTWIYHARVPQAEGVAVRPMTELAAALADADIVLSAVDASEPVVTAEMAAVLADRNVLMVDLGVPRNIDPYFDDCGHGVTVADLDDLKLWHRVKTGTLHEALARADDVIRAEYRAVL